MSGLIDRHDTMTTFNGVYMPLREWECFECQKQFYLVCNDPPRICPECLSIDSVHFLRELEGDDSWIPSNTEKDKRID